MNKRKLITLILALAGLAWLVVFSLSDPAVLAQESTKLNALDRLSENFDNVSYVDDADWTGNTSSHMLIGGVYGTNTITSGDTGPIKLAADGAVQVDVEFIAAITGAVTANAGTNLNTSALALDASVDGLEGGLGAAADAVATQGGEGSVSAKLRLVTSQLNTIDADTGAIKTAVEVIDNNVLASKTLLRARFNASVANGAYLEIAPDPGADTSINIVELSLTQTVQGLTSIWTETGGTQVQEAAEWYFPAYGGIVLQMSQQPHIVASQANENIGLKNETGSTCLYSGHVVYYLE